MRRSVLFLAAVLLGALAALVFVGTRVLDRDRDELYGGYARERLHTLEEAARVLERDLREVGQDLDLAATLLEHVESEELTERQLQAIATIKREYMMLVTRREVDGSESRVVALDAPAGIVERVGPAVSDVLTRAARSPGELVISGPLGRGGDPASWYRVLARWPAGSLHTIAVLVDARVLLARLDLLRDRTTQLYVVGDERATLREQELPPSLYALVDGARRDGTAIAITPPGRRVAPHLPPDLAVAVAVTVRAGYSAPWTLVRVSSAAALRSQERTLVRRLFVGGCVALALLLASAGYVLFNTRRAAALHERLRQADKLAHLTEKAEKILDHIPSGVLALSEELRITATNRWLDARMLRPVIGEPLADAFARAPAAHVAALIGLVERARAAGAPRTLRRERLALLGADALVNVHAIPLERAVAGVSALVVIEDLTPMRRIEERLLHSEKLVTAGQLAAGIAHEIGTPLNIARGRAELALTRLGAEHAQAPAQRVIIDQIDRVTRLIQQLLDYVRPAAAAELAAVDVAAAIERVADLLGTQATKRGVALAADAPAPLPAVRADPDQLQQVLVNLAMNALDACESGGSVALRARAQPSAVVIEVTDDGPGIPRELQPQVFDPFFTTKKRGQGTGLGLWIVAQLVRSHGGELELASEPGAGTTIRITWPTTEAGATA